MVTNIFIKNCKHRSVIKCTIAYIVQKGMFTVVENDIKDLFAEKFAFSIKM